VDVKGCNVDILASVNWEDILLVGSALGVFQGGKLMLSKTKPKENGKYNKALCDERHRTVDRNTAEIKTGLADMSKKIDRLVEHLLGK
jgi:hypothetical protein